MKTCVQCQLSKELTDFSPNGPRRPGLLERRCKACTNLNDRNKRKEDPEAARKKDLAKYWKNPEASRRKNKRHREKNRDEINRRSRERNSKNPEPHRRAVRACRAKKGALRVRAETRERRLKNLDKWRRYHRMYNKAHPDAPRANHLKRKFGLTIGEYATMLDRQKGVCAICKTAAAPSRRLAVDHCHTTGRVRELLCTKCNTALGLFKDSSEIVQNAFWYLCRHARAGKEPEFDRTD